MRLLPLPALLLLPAVAFGDTETNANGEISAEVVPAAATRGEVVTVRITVRPNRGCTTYPFFPAGPQISQNTYRDDIRDPLVYVGPLTDPKAGMKEKRDPATFKSEQVYAGSVTWEVKAVVPPDATPGPGPLELKAFNILVCKETCDTTKRLSAPFRVTDDPPKEVPADYQPWVAAHQAGKPHSLDPKAGPPPAPGTAVPPRTTELAQPPPTSDTPVQTDGLSLQELVAFLLQAAFWGLVSLVTPCVFPMIPITVSLFLKQSNQSTAGALKLAAVYCGTIVVVLGVGATVALKAFVDLSRHPLTNVLLAVMLVAFALSLFGWFDIRLPNFLLRKAEAGRKRGGLLGTVFGAVAFSIVSFTCVAPFLGGFAGLSANPSFRWYHLLFGGLTFGVAFAAPFFVLALFPSLMKKLPRAGGWMDTVKAIMGFLELAAAFKFARTAELLWSDPTVFFTYDLCLAAFVVISGACGLYLLGLFRLPHDDTDRGKLHVLQLILALSFLGFGVHLLPGLFRQSNGENQRPRGVVFAWVDAFLLPDPPGPAPGGESPAGESRKREWSRDLDAEVKRIGGELVAWQTAAANDPNTPMPAKRLIFLDFTGKTCNNCRLNERNVFTRPEVKALLERYVLVQLYTDDVPVELYDQPPPPAQRRAEADANDRLLADKYKTRQLPTYVILEPQTTGEPKRVGVYREGLINDVPAFVEFLRKPLEKK